MIAVATRDPELAKLLRKSIDDEVEFIAHADDPKSLRHEIHNIQPSVVIIDARFGAQDYRAFLAIPRIVGVRSKPQTIALMPWFSQRCYEEVLKMGAFEALDITSEDFSTEIARVVELAERERTSRLRRQVDDDPVTLH
jgi:hypothetical protein